jgi:hypothetical protein
MAGRGPAPKPADKRARRNADVVQLRVVQALPAAKPVLPEFEVERSYKIDGNVHTEMVPFVWPEPTVAWWSMLDAHPLKGEFTDLDWSYLLDTAMLHAEYWRGHTRHAGELRLREAKYGFTPEDRLRLRLQFAQTASAEVDVSRKVSTARNPFAGLRAVDADALEA